MRTKLPPKYSSAPQGGVFWHMMQKYVLPEKNQGFHSPGDFSDEIYHHSISSFLLPERLIRLLAYPTFHPLVQDYVRIQILFLFTFQQTQAQNLSLWKWGKL